jgi:Tol biopolymer transport system component
VENTPLRWSPDSSILAWVASIDSETEASRYQLALTDMASRKTNFLTFGNGFIGILGIAWSPSGNKIIARQGDELQVVSLGEGVVLESEETAQIQSISLRGSSFEGVSWSPDEKFIVYETHWEPYSRIWILELSNNIQAPLASRYADK